MTTRTLPLPTGTDSQSNLADAAEPASIQVEPKPNLAADTLAPSIEALLLGVDRPIPAARIAEVLGLAPPESGDSLSAALAEPTPDQPTKKRKGGKNADSPTARIAAAIDSLNSTYETTGRAFRIQLIAGGYRVMTLPKFAPILEAYHGKREQHGLSRAALETLAIIAYKQPITRAALEAIRGVACGEVLRSLIERRLVTVTGRAEELGRPMLYGTTRAFLESFGLATIKDLPTAEDLRLGGENDADSGTDT